MKNSAEIQQMELTEISRIVSELDDGISKENAKVSFKSDEYEDESYIVATQNGYLRLGVEFLKAGFAQYNDSQNNPHEIDVDLDYLTSIDSDVNYYYFERNEILPTVNINEETWRDRGIGLVLGAVLISIPILAIVGLVSIIRALL